MKTIYKTLLFLVALAVLVSASPIRRGWEDDKMFLREKKQSDNSREWTISEWSECTATCGGGLRTRSVRCLDEDKVISDDCDRDNMPESYEFCNQIDCSTLAPDISLLPPSGENTLTNDDGSMTVISFDDQGQGNFEVQQNTTEVDGAVSSFTYTVTPTTRRTSTRTTGRRYRFGFQSSQAGMQVDFVVDGNNLFSLNGIQQTSLSGNQNLMYENGVIMLSDGTMFSDIERFYYYDGFLLYQFNGSKINPLVGEGELYIDPSTGVAFYSINGELNAQINDVIATIPTTPPPVTTEPVSTDTEPPDVNATDPTSTDPITTSTDATTTSTDPTTTSRPTDAATTSTSPPVTSGPSRPVTDRPSKRPDITRTRKPGRSPSKEVRPTFRPKLPTSRPDITRTRKPGRSPSKEVRPSFRPKLPTSPARKTPSLKDNERESISKSRGPLPVNDRGDSSVDVSGTKCTSSRRYRGSSTMRDSGTSSSRRSSRTEESDSTSVDIDSSSSNQAIPLKLDTTMLSFDILIENGQIFLSQNNENLIELTSPEELEVMNFQVISFKDNTITVTENGNKVAKFTDIESLLFFNGKSLVEVPPDFGDIDTESNSGQLYISNNQAFFSTSRQLNALIADQLAKQAPFMIEIQSFPNGDDLLLINGDPVIVINGVEVRDIPDSQFIQYANDTVFVQDTARGQTVEQLYDIVALHVLNGVEPGLEDFTGFATGEIPGGGRLYVHEPSGNAFYSRSRSVNAAILARLDSTATPSPGDTIVFVIQFGTSSNGESAIRLLANGKEVIVLLSDADVRSFTTQQSLIYEDGRILILDGDIVIDMLEDIDELVVYDGVSITNFTRTAPDEIVGGGQIFVSDGKAFFSSDAALSDRIGEALMAIAPAPTMTTEAGTDTETVEPTDDDETSVDRSSDEDSETSGTSTTKSTKRTHTHSRSRSSRTRSSRTRSSRTRSSSTRSSSTRSSSKSCSTQRKSYSRKSHNHSHRHSHSHSHSHSHRHSHRHSHSHSASDHSRTTKSHSSSQEYYSTTTPEPDSTSDVNKVMPEDVDSSLDLAGFSRESDDLEESQPFSTSVTDDCDVSSSSRSSSSRSSSSRTSRDTMLSKKEIVYKL